MDSFGLHTIAHKTKRWPSHEQWVTRVAKCSNNEGLWRPVPRRQLPAGWAKILRLHAKYIIGTPLPISN